MNRAAPDHALWNGPAGDDVALEWTPRIALGVPALDADHQALFYYVREYIDAIEDGRSFLIIDGIFASLLDYTQTHFAREEAVMEACGYPGLAEHRARHRILAVQVLDARDRYLLTPSEELDEDLKAFLLNWLGRHIVRTDFDMRPWLAGRERQIARALADAGERSGTRLTCREGR